MLRIAAPVVHAKQTARCRVTLHNFSSCRTPGTQRFNVLARLQFGADMRRLTVIEVFEIVIKAVD
ncbi:MAG: hypothetical protein E7I85_13035 [Enterobacter sp.]|nr:hypothetical protein [Enterobacter sp.]